MEKVIRAIRKMGRLKRLQRKITVQESRKDIIRCGGGGIREFMAVLI